VSLGHSLVISLPSDWCREFGVVKGSIISINSNEEMLCIYPTPSFIELEHQPQNEVYTKSAHEEPTPPKPIESNINIEAIIRKKLGENNRGV
jgi:hypothetical protein